VITTLAYTVCASAVAFLLFKQQDLGRSVVLVSAVFNFFLLVLTRSAYRGLHKSIVKDGLGRHRTLIVGAGQTGALIRFRMENHPLVDHHIVGFVDDGLQAGSEVDGIPVLGGMKDLFGLIDEHDIDEVFFANPDASSHDILDLISAYRSMPAALDVTFKVASEDMFQFITTRVNLEEVDNFPVVELNVRETSAFYMAAKRLIDVVLALFLGIIAALLFPLIVVAIKIESPGTVIFRHKRIGKDAKPFIMYKFRTMRRDVNEYQEAPIEPEYSRIIPWIGTFLRRTSLDELPQLWNVLKGEMSMVGPRPEMPFLVERYQPWQKMRLSVKPGITGLWQIIGRKDLPLYANLEYDFYYIQNQSLMLDVLILLKTIPSVLFGKGAY
jgi:exopolysaccharide biosynthesis polyprenyl glycosylphosphotransferase